MLTEKLINKIKTVLDSDMTAYRIAKEVGYAGANPIHDYRSGKSDILKMQLGTAIAFEKLYKEALAMKTYWEFENYTVYDEDEVLRFENTDGETIGYVSAHENHAELVNDLNNGADPIGDGWDDGLGNIVCIEGWGEHEKIYCYDGLEYGDRQVNVEFVLNNVEEILKTYEQVKYSDTDPNDRPDVETLKDELANDLGINFEETLEANEDTITIGYKNKDTGMNDFMSLDFEIRDETFLTVELTLENDWSE